MTGKQDRYIKGKLDAIYSDGIRKRSALDQGDLLSQEEKDTFFSFLLLLADNIELGPEEEWTIKIEGIIQFLRWSGRITEDQDEKLLMLVNEILDKEGTEDGEL